MSSEYNQLLKFLYFEGYADSYEEAENLLEDMSDEEFEDLLERKYDFDEPLPGSGKTPRQKMERKRGQHAARVMLGNPALGRSVRNDPERDSYSDRASMMDRVKDSLDRGEDPRDDEGRKNLIKAARRPRASYERQDNRPGGLRANRTRAGGYRTLVRREETEIQEEQYRTTASGRRVRWDENEATDKDVSNMLQKRREAAAKKAAQERMKAKGTVPKKDGKDVFEEVVEYLFVEGYADTIESAELMAESISAEWVDEILDEKHVKAMDTTGRGPDRRTRFPRFKGKDDEFDPEFLRKRVNRNDKKIDPYFSGRKERKDERRQAVGGFNEAKADPQDAVQRLITRNKRLVVDHPEVPSGRPQTEFRRKRHEESRGKKKG